MMAGIYHRPIVSRGPGGVGGPPGFGRGGPSPNRTADKASAGIRSVDRPHLSARQARDRRGGGVRVLRTADGSSHSGWNRDGQLPGTVARGSAALQGEGTFDYQITVRGPRVQVDTPHEHPQRWLLAVPRALPAADRERAQAMIAAVRGGPLPVVEHDVGAPFADGDPWVLFGDGFGVLREASAITEAKLHSTIHGWSRKFRAR
jgi:hypothetical protein